MKQQRIKILDGFRAIAIIPVMLYHFFSRWTPPDFSTSYYPYTNRYNYFEYGHLGVQFFFIISGFVIFYTLEKTESISIFWRKRMIRLFPSMFIASLLTFIFVYFFDAKNLFYSSHFLKNFIPGLTFITPELLNKIFSFAVVKFNYLNGSYWSLWPEIQFYFLSSILYFISKKNFVRNYVFSALIIILINWFFVSVNGSNKLNLHISDTIITTYNYWIRTIFNLSVYCIYFTLGVMFFVIYKSRIQQTSISVFFKIAFIFLILLFIYFGVHWDVRLIYMAMLFLFFCFIYFPDKLYFLQTSFIAKIGVSSYFIYLIHENIGVLIINSLGERFMPLGFILPILLIMFFVFIGNLYTNTIDKRINNYLKGWL